MDWNIVLDIIQTLIVPAIIGYWLWYKERQQHRMSREIDREEYSQQTGSDALDQVLKTQERLIEHQISMLNGKFGSLGDKIEASSAQLVKLISILTRIETGQTLTNRDWSRVDEIVSDIDLILHRLEAALNARGITSEEYAQHRKITGDGIKKSDTGNLE